MVKKLKQLILLLLTTYLTPAVFADSQVFLKDFSGQSKSIEQFVGKGKWQVVWIWASDCHICNQEAQEYTKFHTKFEKTNAQVIGVSIDGEERKAEAEVFLARHKLTFPNLISEPADFMLHYLTITGAPFLGTPSILLYAPDGELRAAEVGAVPIKIIEDYIAKNSDAPAIP